VDIGNLHFNSPYKQCNYFTLITSSVKTI